MGGVTHPDSVRLSQEKIEALVREALIEDVGSGDITAALIPADQFARAKVMTREPMILCGKAFAEAVFHAVDARIQAHWQHEEGDLLAKNQVLCELEGPARSLLTAERTALNFLQMLSGTATQVHHYVEALKGTPTQLLDTRKTIPLFRLAQKYAVTVGGGRNHRMGLYDAFLIKENHIAAAGSIQQAVHVARTLFPDKKIEVEVENQGQLAEAIACHVDIVMLDNFSQEEMQAAVALNQHRVQLEVSGNVTLKNIREIAETGVDFISVGSLTKHIQAIDLSMRFTSLRQGDPVLK